MQIQLHPSQHHFTCDEHETILEAALRSGLSVEYGCNSGRCGDCKARIISGQLQQERFHDYQLSQMEQAQGYTLLCTALPATDMVIEVCEQGIEQLPQQHIKAKISKLALCRKDVMELHVRTPRSQALRFMAGQSVELSLPQLPTRTYPIASCPCNGQVLHFHIPYIRDDLFSEHVFTKLKNRQDIIVDGPSGHFTLDDDSTRPIIFIAYDIGFSYIKSLIEHAISLDLQQPIYFYWLSCHPDDHYLKNYCRAWQDALDNFHVILLNDIDQAGQCLAQGAIILNNNHPDLNTFDIYMATSQTLVEQLQPSLLAQDFPPERLFITTSLPA